MNFKVAVAGLMAIVLLSPGVFAYLDQSFAVTVKVGNDGNAKITEKTVFFLENEEEKKAFDYYLGLGKTTLFDWQRFSKNIKYHFSGSVSDLRIVATREFLVHPNAASVTLEYDADNVMLLEGISSRITKYRFNTPLISLTSAKGEISLGNAMSFTLELPDDADAIKVSPDPGVGRREKTITWTGPIFGVWDVEFIREGSLSSEVNAFFAQTVENLRHNYLWILLVLFALLLVAKVIQQKPQE
ncbi:MAG TPA: hypothetical protein VJI71_02260 [Candidatus Norongarragalinales archaeon]|nr:hypothetical protein [Candidatus Norongarragalinales archaeon]